MVNHVIYSLGAPMKRKLTDQNKIEIVEKYKTGNYNCVQLGKEYGVTNNSIISVLDVRGIQRSNDWAEFHRKYKFNRDFFEKIDNEEKAYFLGFLYSDGCNHYNPLKNRNRISLEIQEKDISIVEKFRECINGDMPIHTFQRFRKEYNTQPMCIIDLNSSKMCKDLINVGCVPRKSLVLEFPDEKQVPSNLLSHFIRGYYDGDGGISLNYSNYRIKITSTFKFLEKLKKIIKINLNIDGGLYLKKNKITADLVIGGNNQVIKFLDWLYSKCLINLKRKYNIYLELKDKYKDINIYNLKKYCYVNEGKFKPVIQKDINGNIVKLWESVSSTKLEGFNIQSVSNASNGRYNKTGHFYKNFYWYKQNI